MVAVDLLEQVHAKPFELVGADAVVTASPAWSRYLLNFVRHSRAS